MKTLTLLYINYDRQPVNTVHRFEPKHTVLVTIKLQFYASATGTGMGTGLARVCIRVQHGYGYGHARNTATGVPGVQAQV